MSIGIPHLVLCWSLFVFVNLAAATSISDNGAASIMSARATENQPACVNDATNEAGDYDDALIFHISPEQRQALLSSSTPEEFASKFQEFIHRVKSAFDAEGVVVIRGLLGDDLLNRLEADSQEILDNSERIPTSTFTSVKFGPVFSDTALREAALSSAIPRFVAVVLLNMDHHRTEEEDSSALHMLKDAFLAKGGEKKCCGWHVDDAGFWPTNARSRPGVNAWIAIDDIPARYGGGLAVSPHSHRASWRQRAYEAIGSTQIQPEEGLAVGTPLFDSVFKTKIPGSGYGKTCKMEDEDPAMARIIDGTRKVFDFQKGDVLFHTRWIFHRSMPLTKAGAERFQQMGKEPTFKRYSIRYDYGDSHLLRGLNAEFAALLNSENKGKTLAEISRDDGPFYPRCWPNCMDGNEIKELDRLVIDKFPLAEVKRGEYLTKIFQEISAASKE